MDKDEEKINTFEDNIANVSVILDTKQTSKTQLPRKSRDEDVLFSHRNQSCRAKRWLKTYKMLWNAWFVTKWVTIDANYDYNDVIEV